MAAVVVLASSVGLAPYAAPGTTGAGTNATAASSNWTVAGAGDATLVGAGDIAVCGETGDAATATLLDGIEGTVFTTGDNVYPDGSAAGFSNCFGPSWGRHRDRIRPSAGNHDYITPGAAAYYTYFGDRAGPPGLGYYSYDLGAWHVVVLNSNCPAVSGCGETSPQVQWLRDDLESTQSECIAAYWHHPRFSSGTHGSNPAMATFWRTLHDHGVDVVLNGHDHLYERFAPQDAAGNPDPSGPRQFTVGTGGGPLYSLRSALATSERRIVNAHGVLALNLRATGYEWEFIPASPSAAGDSGAASCHLEPTIDQR